MVVGGGGRKRRREEKETRRPSQPPCCFCFVCLFFTHHPLLRPPRPAPIHLPPSSLLPPSSAPHRESQFSPPHSTSMETPQPADAYRSSRVTTARSIDLLFHFLGGGGFFFSSLPLNLQRCTVLPPAPSLPPNLLQATRELIVHRLSLSCDCYSALNLVTAGVGFFLNGEQVSIPTGPSHFFFFFFLGETTRCRLTPALLALLWTAEGLGKKYF